MRVEVRQLTGSLGMTTIYVTHDQVEALAMSDRIALMRDGRIVQEGPPREVYFQPVDTFVAEFLGGSNIFAKRAVDGQAGMVETALGCFSCTPPADLIPGDSVDLIIRPEGFRLCACASAPPGAANRIEGRVEDITFTGGSIEARFRVNDHLLRVKLDPFADIRPGAMAQLEMLSDRCAVVPSATSPLKEARRAVKSG